MELNKAFSRKEFMSFLCDDFLTDFQTDEREVRVPNNSLFKSVTQLGVSNDSEVTVLEVLCDEIDVNKRIITTQNAFRVLREHGISNALIAFHYNTGQWRFSLLTSTLELKNNKVVKKESNPRRYSYFLGIGTKTVTPYKYLIEKGQVSNLQSLKERFSVEIVNKQFYNSLANLYTELVGGERSGNKYPGLLEIYGHANSSMKHQEFAVRLIGRIMFCWFLKEKKSKVGVSLVPEEILSLNAINNHPEYYHNVLEPLFFELLNKRPDKRRKEHKQPPFTIIPYLNGGLFNHHPDDLYEYSEATESGRFGLVSIPDKWFESLFEILSQYNFTVDENTSYDADISIDPEMLGRIFENLLAELNPETGKSARRSTGSFYTPREIVEFMVDSSLLHFIEDKTKISKSKLRTLIGYAKEDDDNKNFLSDLEKGQIVDALANLTILDPACGSGAFPIGILQKVVYILQQVDENANLWFDKQLQGISSTELRHDIESKYKSGNYDYLRKLGVIRESIFGIDIQVIATEIAKLRCFLSLIIEEDVDDSLENRGIRPLPNLDFKFITANSLRGLDDKDSVVKSNISIFEDVEHIKELQRIRNEYFTADFENRDKLKTKFKKIQEDMHKNTINLSKASTKYGSLAFWEPFEGTSADWFDPEWMFGVKHFDIIIANPPYIHLESIKEQSKKYKELNYKTYEARGDIYALFYEKGVELLSKNGILCYITSNKWMRADYGNSLRKFLADYTNPIQLIDFAGQQVFDATVDTNILILTKSKNQLQTDSTTIKNPEGLKNLSVYVKQNSYVQRFDSGDSWSILSPIEESIKRKIETIGKPLKDWDIQMNYGIKTGFNEAFIINGVKRAELLHEDPKSDEIIRPILRGRDIKRYGYEFADLYVIFAYYGSSRVIPSNYPAIYEHLCQFEEQLRKRGQCRYTASGKPRIGGEFPGQHHWLELDNNPSIELLDDFSKQKIVWGNLNLTAQYALVNEAIFVNAPSPMITPGSEYLLAFLNSNTGDWWIKLLGVGRSGGFLEYKPMFVELFPVPLPNGEIKKQLTALIRIRQAAKNPEEIIKVEKQINRMIYSIYCFTEEEITVIET